MPTLVQITGRQQVDPDGFSLQNQLYVPTGATKGFTSLQGTGYGTDSTTADYAMLAPAVGVVPFSEGQSGGTTWAIGTTSPQTVTIAAPAAGLANFVALVLLWIGTGAAQSAAVTCPANWMNGMIFGASSTATVETTYALPLPGPWPTSTGASSVVFSVSFSPSTTVSSTRLSVAWIVRPAN